MQQVAGETQIGPTDLSFLIGSSHANDTQLGSCATTVEAFSSVYLWRCRSAAVPTGMNQVGLKGQETTKS